jgi:hypothetical protein
MKHGLQEFQQALLKAYSDVAGKPGEQSDEDDFVIRNWGPGEQPYHYNLVLRHPAPDYTQLVRDEREILLSRNKGAAWWKVHDFPSGTRDELQKTLPREGFKFVRKSSMLYMPITERVARASSIEVRRMLPEDSLSALQEIHDEVWGPGYGEHLQSLHDSIRVPDPKTQIYFARVRGEPEWASIGWIQFRDKVGFLFGGSTRPAFRGMGTYRTLVAARIEAAAEAGMEFVMSECTSESERVLKALGFHDAGVATVYEFKASHHAEFRKRLSV